MTYYITVHRHSEIGLHTPPSVHDGTWRAIDEHRQHVLDTAYTAHLERFRKGRPRPPRPPEEAWINRPTINTTTHTGTAA